MKKLLLFLMLFRAATYLSQTINYADHEGNEITFGSVCINSKTYYLTSSNKITGCCSDEVWLVAKNDQGTELWRKHLATEAWMSRCRLSVGADKALIVYAGTDIYGCDYEGARTHVKRVDTSGVVWWTKIHPRSFINVNPQKDGTFYLISLDSIFHCGNTGQLIGSKSLGLPNNAKSATVLMNGQVLINYISASGPRFRVNTLSGTNVKDIQTTANLNFIRQAGDSSFVCLAGKDLERYSKNLGFLKNSTAFLPSTVKASAYDLRHDTIFVAGETTNQSPIFYLLDTAFNVLHQGNSNVEGVTCTGISVNNKNKLNVMCYGKTALSQAYFFSGVFQTGFNGNLNAKSDVGVISTNVLSSKYFINGTYAYIEINAAVTVQNFGIDTIRSFHLTDHVLLTGISYCFLGLNKRYDQKIAPGDSTTVFTGTYITDVVSSSAPATIPYSLCLSTSVPNQSNDIDITNDVFCKTLNLTRVGLDEIDFEHSIKMYPNPSVDEIFIESADLIHEVDVFANNGSQICLYRPLSVKFLMPTENLDAGIYAVKIRTKKGTVVKRFVVQ